jgi:hypothetical protein
VCKIIVRIHRYEPPERIDVEPPQKRRLVLVDADRLPPGAVDLWGRSLTIPNADPVAAESKALTDARLVKDLQASTDQMLLSASITWRTAQQAAFELGLSYAALCQRLRRHPPPHWAAHRNRITAHWQINVPGLRMWWAVGELSFAAAET